MAALKAASTDCSACDVRTMRREIVIGLWLKGEYMAVRISESRRTLPDVVNHANNLLHRFRRKFRVADFLADRIFIREVLPGECLVDDHDVWL